MPESWFDNLTQTLGPLVDPNTLPGAVFIGVLVFGSAWLLSVLLGLLIRHWEEHFRKIFRGVEETVWRFTLHLKSLAVFFIALVVYASIIPGLRTILTTLAAGAGLTAVVLGFAAKSTLANLISGISLAVFRPIRIGDTVTIENEFGVIEDITIRHTVLLTWEHKRIVIPNEKLDNTTIVNYSLNDPRMLLRLEMGISYDTDIDLARRLILEEVRRCPQCLVPAKALSEPAVRVIDHGDFAIKLRVYMWTANIDEAWQGRFWLLEMIKKRFDREGVEIPFPYRTVVYKKDLPPARGSGDGAWEEIPEEKAPVVVEPSQEQPLIPDSEAERGRFWSRAARFFGKRR